MSIVKLAALVVLVRTIDTFIVELTGFGNTMTDSTGLSSPDVNITVIVSE
jgi:hypothetical protein